MNVDTWAMPHLPSGAILLGATASGRVESGTWVHLEFVDGAVAGLAEQVDPDDYVIRTPLPVIGTPVGIVDLKMALKATELSSIEANVVESFERGMVHVTGDEAYFIRYSDAMLRLVETAARVL